MSLKLSKLKTIKNYASMERVTPSYIYKLIRENKLEIVMIDGVQFIDTERFPNLPETIKRR
ncbi:MAG: hypothetical protein C0459_01890 [Chitinophaga sp.]|jgi:hypothetical protein|nr:hypothetical protein [Chitinophaga sp.]